MLNTYYLMNVFRGRKSLTKYAFRDVRETEIFRLHEGRVSRLSWRSRDYRYVVVFQNSAEGMNCYILLWKCTVWFVLVRRTWSGRVSSEFVLKRCQRYGWRSGSHWDAKWAWGIWKWLHVGTADSKRVRISPHFSSQISTCLALLTADKHNNNLRVYTAS